MKQVLEYVFLSQALCFMLQSNFSGELEKSGLCSSVLGGGGKKKKKKRRHRTIFTSYQVIEEAIYTDLCLGLCLLGEVGLESRLLIVRSDESYKERQFCPSLKSWKRHSRRRTIPTSMQERCSALRLIFLKTEFR